MSIWPPFRLPQRCLKNANGCGASYAAAFGSIAARVEPHRLKTLGYAIAIFFETIVIFGGGRIGTMHPLQGHLETLAMGPVNHLPMASRYSKARSCDAGWPR